MPLVLYREAQVHAGNKWPTLGSHLRGRVWRIGRHCDNHWWAGITMHEEGTCHRHRLQRNQDRRRFKGGGGQGFRETQNLSWLWIKEMALCHCYETHQTEWLTGEGRREHGGGSIDREIQMVAEVREEREDAFREKQVKEYFLGEGRCESFLAWRNDMVCIIG